MTETVSLESIKTILENKGYNVMFGPPDKAVDNQISIEISDVYLEIETPNIYHIHTVPSISLSTSHPELLTAKIKTLVEDVENGLYANSLLNRGTFKFTGTKFTKPGELYCVSLLCDFFDSIIITI